LFIFAASNSNEMETITKQKTPKKTNSIKKMPARLGSDLTKIFGWGKGRISYDESIFNFGKRKVTV
jgi:hypothetical protein